jgi:endonuclease/exonuclease/phosphatase family metal-dependent hydrolase
MRRREFLRALTSAAAVGATGAVAGRFGWTTSRSAAAAVAATATTNPTSGGRPPVTLRVMTFNIHHGEGTDKRLDLDRIAGVIRAADPDLVCLQEVERNATRTGKIDQGGQARRADEVAGRVRQGDRLPGGEYGVAVLSKHELGEPAVHPLPGKPGEEKRCLLTVTATLPGGRTVRVAATHLNHRNADERLKQARAIVERLMATGGAAAGAATGPAGVAKPAADVVPTLLAGDLNAEPTEASITALGPAFADVSGAADPALLTFPDDKPTKRIDYVLAGPPTAWRAVSAAAPDPRAASDHRPVVAVVELVRVAGR